MKRIIITLVAACISLAAIAHEPYIVYCEVWGSTTTNIIGYIYIDFGQDDISRNWLVDSNGKGLHFNSMIQAINYMAERGWELEAAYNSHAPYYLNENKIETRHTLIMSKMVRSRDEITEGIYTRNMHKNR
mgnify:FL=1